MSKPRPVRTFITLDPFHLDFIRSLQGLVQARGRNRRRPTMHGIIRGILVDYQRMLELGSNADFLTAYEAKKDHRQVPRKKKGALFAGEPFVVESI